MEEVLKVEQVGKYSMGMRQRLGLAQAVMEDLDFLILDEPMNGLDMHWLEVTRNLLMEMKVNGKTILLASHSKQDIDVLFDRIIRLKEGKIVGETNQVTLGKEILVDTELAR